MVVVVGRNFHFKSSRGNIFEVLVESCQGYTLHILVDVEMPTSKILGDRSRKMDKKDMQLTKCSYTCSVTSCFSENQRKILEPLDLICLCSFSFLTCTDAVV